MDSLHKKGIKWEVHTKEGDAQRSDTLSTIRIKHEINLLLQKLDWWQKKEKKKKEITHSSSPTTIQTKLKQLASVPSLRTSLCRKNASWKLSIKVEMMMVRKTPNAPKGPEVTLRNIWSHKNFDIWWNSWETEIKISDVELRPNSIRESQLAERGITRNNQHMQIKTHLRATLWVRRPRRKFIMQAIAKCIRQKSSNSLQMPA